MILTVRARDLRRGDHLVASRRTVEAARAAVGGKVLVRLEGEPHARTWNPDTTIKIERSTA